MTSIMSANSPASGYANSLGQSSSVQGYGIMSTPFKNPNVTPAILQCDPVRAEEMSRTIYIGNLPISITDDQLRDFLKSVGNLVNMKIAGENTASLTGSGKYAFLEFETQSQAEKALKLNGVVLGDRAIRVNHSRNAIYKPLVRSNATLRRAGNYPSESASKRMRESADKGSKVKDTDYSRRSSFAKSDRRDSNSRSYSRSPENQRRYNEEKSGKIHRHRDESPSLKHIKPPPGSPQSYKNSKSRTRVSLESKPRHSDHRYSLSPRDRLRSSKSYDTEKSRRDRVYSRDHGDDWYHTPPDDKLKDHHKKDYDSYSSKDKSKSRDRYYREREAEKLKDSEKEKSKEKVKRKDRDSDKNKDKERDADKDKDSSRSRKRSRDKKSEKNRSEGSRKKHKEREAHSSERSYSKERSRDRSRPSEKDRDHKRDKYRWKSRSDGVESHDS